MCIFKYTYFSIMSDEIFNDRYVCLVLACNREFYNTRRQKNSDTFNILKKSNFVIVYLFADNSIDAIKITEVAPGMYNMIVPAPEMYELISYKMNLAYNYFSNKKVKGILKIDDNTIISYPDIIEHDFTDLINNSKYDYIGLEKVIVKKEGNNYIKMKNRTPMPILGNIYHKLDIDISYFGGPFYYLSPKAIKQISTTGLIFGYEDFSVGYSVSKNPALKIFTWNFKNKGISWDNEKEIDTDKNKSSRKN
jgi:hypothetical protein